MGQPLFFEGVALRGSARAVGAHVCGARGVKSNAHVVGFYDQDHFASADAKVVCGALAAENLFGGK